MRLIQKIPAPEEVCDRFPITESEKKKREEVLAELRHIILGKSEKKILLIGPCSADREDAVLEYVSRLAVLAEVVKDSFLIIPRVYTSKPRTNGDGYKGMIHRPVASGGEDDLVSGLLAVRKLQQRVIQESGLFPADELLYPSLYPYVADLLVYMAVGARSVEDQEHRLVASGMKIPVGMKNPTSGNISVMLNAVAAAQQQQRIIFNGWEAQTEGNPFVHCILRGYTTMAGESVPNYYYENLVKLYDRYYRQNLSNPAVIIDCNHANSNKQYDEQLRIAEDVMTSCKRNRTINSFVKGLMVESYLVDGAQMIGESVYGKSITDPCIGWEKTTELVQKVSEMI
ncbi:MAG: 3-deoxy-7-phosphoheptulonate synthase [Lachnospiraceae bacterium]|nr:3-deoxy-7-phosphoheptulonate synthase [Lachnospiraceae bacterium]